MVFNPLGPQSPEPLGRILTQALNHHNQIPPLHGVCPLLGIILGQTEPATLQSLDIHHHTAVLGMDKLHELAAVADEDEDIAVPHLRTEFILYDAHKGIDALAHVCETCTQVVTHRVVQREHGSPRLLRKTSINTFSEPLPKWALNPLGKARLTPPISPGILSRLRQ